MTKTRVELATDFVQDVLAREGAAWVSAASSSMAPLVQRGDELRLAPFAAARVHAGAIVAFRRGGELVVHRVLRRAPGGVVTQGDALGEADSPVVWSRVIGRIVAIRTPLRAAPRARPVAVAADRPGARGGGEARRSQPARVDRGARRSTSWRSSRDDRHAEPRDRVADDRG